MSDLALDARPGGEPRLLAPWTVAILLVLGIGSFVAMLVFGAYAPDLRRGGGAGGHALSDAVIGYSGLVRLADATGRVPRIVRDAHGFDTEDLLVVTPPSGYTDLSAILKARADKPTLVVLPKWATQASADHRGWVTVSGLIDKADPAATFSPTATFTMARAPSGGRPLTVFDSGLAGIALAAPKPVQAIHLITAPAQGNYGTLERMIGDEGGDIVLGRFADRPLYVLADPDLIDNRGIRDPAAAAAALALIDRLNAQGGSIAFDVTLNGLGGGASPLKLLFEPPFLAVTLTLAAAVLLAALTTVTRFGSPRPRARAVALGKTALIDNTAALVARARAEPRLGGRYAQVIREAAARAFAAPPRLAGGALDAYLDRVGRRRGANFTALAQAVAAADDKADLLHDAQALHDWMTGRQA